MCFMRMCAYGFIAVVSRMMVSCIHFDCMVALFISSPITGGSGMCHVNTLSFAILHHAVVFYLMCFDTYSVGFHFRVRACTARAGTKIRFRCALHRTLSYCGMSRDVRVRHEAVWPVCQCFGLRMYVLVWCGVARGATYGQFVSCVSGLATHCATCLQVLVVPTIT